MRLSIALDINAFASKQRIWYSSHVLPCVGERKERLKQGDHIRHSTHLDLGSEVACILLVALKHYRCMNDLRNRDPPRGKSESADSTIQPYLKY